MQMNTPWLSAVKGVSGDACYWFLWNSVGSLFPVLLGILISIAISQTPHLSDYSRNGQFFLYSVTFLASSFSIINKNYRQGLNFPLRSFFSWVVGICWAFSSVMFALMVLSGVGSPIANLNYRFIQPFSYCLYLLAFFVALIVTSVDLHFERKAATINVGEERQKERDLLLEQFNKLGN